MTTKSEDFTETSPGGSPAMVGGRRRWRNWLGNETFDVSFAEPANEREVAALVRRAKDRSEQLRVVGSAHSNTPLFRTSGTLLSTSKLTGLVACDASSGRAAVRAGTPIHDIGDIFWAHGLALTNQGDIDAQTIAGAIGTGTHGSGLQLGSISASLRRARLVTGNAEVIEIDESTPDLLRAAQVSMGMLGVMTEVDLQVSPAYILTEWKGHAPLDTILPVALELASRHRHFSFLWTPTHEGALKYGLAPEDGSDATDLCVVKMYDIGGVDPRPLSQFGHVHRTDRSYRIYPESVWLPNFWEIEYFMPLDTGMQALEDLRALIAAEFPGQIHYPIEVRFTAGDEACLSQNYGEPTISVVACGDPHEVEHTFMDRCIDVFNTHRGRPHWGKYHRVDRNLLRARFPLLDDFVAVRRELDPDGIFLNDYLRPMFQ